MPRQWLLSKYQQKPLLLERLTSDARARQANAISERWVKSPRTECLDHLFIFNEVDLVVLR